MVQFNGRDTVQIKNFYANYYGKVVRNCGNCSGNGGPRNIVINNVIAKDNASSAVSTPTTATHASSRMRARTATFERLVALKDQCAHPTSNKPYISSLRVGRDNSPEGLQNGLTHGFVVEFKSAEDRDYYGKTDPAYQAFVASMDGGLVNKITVLDFIDGVY